MTVPKTPGKYQIESFLGKGASAEVHQAMDMTLKRTVALKLLGPALVVDEEAFARCVQEAQTLASLVHQGAQAFCAWMSKVASDKVCVPTEAEWEKVAHIGNIVCASSRFMSYPSHPSNTSATVVPA